MVPHSVATAVAATAFTALIATPARAAQPDFTACFGGAPEAVAAASGKVGELRINERYLFWTGQRMELAGRTVDAGPGPGDDARAWDAREAFAVTAGIDLVARDLATGAERVVFGRQQRADSYTQGSLSIALDDTYVYLGMLFGQHPPDVNDAGIYRVRRDGSKPPEWIGPAPNARQPFVGAGGFVYWVERDGLLRRRLLPGAPEETIAPSGAGSWPNSPIRIAGDHVYYVDGRSIWSRPADGTGTAVEQAIGPETRRDMIRDLVVVPPCLYIATGRSIRRARLGGDARQTQEIADERNYSGNIVSDGRFLYWADAEGTRILRAGPSGSVFLPPVPDPVATGAPAARTRVPSPYTISVGAGWGCVQAKLPEEVFAAWHCWQAPARAPATGAPPPIGARRVPWLTGVSAVGTADRFCGVVGGEARCWKWPDLLRAAPAQLPSRQSMDTPRATAGGVTTCVSVRALNDLTGRWRCTGDTRFGPGALDTGAEAAQVSDITLGRWHGCVGRRGADAQCWGRGDGGQLGYEPDDRCGPRGHEIRCAKEPHAIPFKPSGTLLAGDMYTCAFSGRGPLACWGASRDGLFGSAAACPPELVKAWPTLDGTVAAPTAGCSATPVNVPGFKHLSYDVSAGPRGICGVVQGRVRCAGAIRTPTGSVTSPRVSPGDDASACGIADDQAVCWGERYSPADDPTQPVAIAFDTSAPAGLPVVDTPVLGDTPWADPCNVHFGCDRPVAPLPPCALGKAGRPWPAIAAGADKLKDTTITVRGRLLVGRLASHGTTVTDLGAIPTPSDRCQPGQCCNRATRPVVVADDGAGAPEGLRLGEIDCRGDDSRLCCNAPAFGQTVMATGKLAWNYDGWALANPELCVVPSRRGRSAARDR